VKYYALQIIILLLLTSCSSPAWCSGLIARVKTQVLTVSYNVMPDAQRI